MSICADFYSGITFGTLYINSNWSWRLPSLLQSAPSFVQLLLVLLLPESPRWLVSRGKDEQALNILAKYHANGNREDPLVRFEYAEMKVSIRQGEQKGRWSELFKTRESFPTHFEIMPANGPNNLISPRRQSLSCVYLSLLRCLLSVLRDESDGILPAQYPRSHRYH